MPPPRLPPSPPRVGAAAPESQRRHLLHQRLWRRLAVDVTVGGYLVPKHTDLFLHIGEACRPAHLIINGGKQLSLPTTSQRQS